MRVDVSTITLTMLALSWGSVARADGAGTLTLKLGKESHLWVEGDSTLHKYRLDAKELHLEMEVSGAAPGEKLQALLVRGAPSTLNVRVPVGALRSGENGLDENMRSALKAEKNPDIRFQLTFLQATNEAASSTLKPKGRLQIAGVEKPVELDAQATPEATGLHVTGVKQLRMTDYGVKPPTFMLGAMRCRDAVSIHFDLHLEPTP